MIRKSTTTSVAALLLMLGTSIAAHAQQAVASDVKPGDWAYNAVQDLASKGLIQGYPPTGDFLGGRALTRYEMATIIDRILAKFDDLAQAGGTNAATQTQIDELKQLVSQYHVELTVIGANITQAQADITKLEGDVATLQQGLSSAYDAIEEQSKRVDKLKAQVANDEATTYSSNPKSKFNIGGYIQVRAVSAQSGNTRRFPQGSSAAGGAYNGNYAQGGTQDGIQVRRARLRLAGAPTANTSYAAQLDFQGAVAGGSGVTANQQVTVREAWGSYTFGNGTSAYPTVAAGLFATPFGYVLPVSMSTTLTPERPLAFSESGNVGLFNSQDYDKGLKAQYGYKSVNLTYAVINGDGRQSENLDSHFDNLVRLNYVAPSKIFSVGASYYGGHILRTLPTGVTAGSTYPVPKKELVGLDAQVTLKNGIFADGEYVRGTYESRSYFDEAKFTTAAPTGGDGLQDDTYVKGNQVQGYYFWAGYTLGSTGTHPLTLGADYDVFQRSISANTGNASNTFANAPTASGGNASFDDVNYGYGALYNLDRATRLRLWYDQPTKVAHEPNTPTPPKIGLLTAELQFKY